MINNLYISIIPVNSSYRVYLRLIFFMLDKNIWNEKTSHGEILKKIWKHLDLGTLEREHPFHTPVFGTICGGAPDLRVVVLRRFWRKNPRASGFSRAQRLARKSRKSKAIRMFPGFFITRRKNFRFASKARRPFIATATS